MDPITEIDLGGPEPFNLSEATTLTVEDGDGHQVAAQCQGGCDEWFAEEDWQNEGQSGNLDDARLCDSCHESDTTYPSTLHRFVPGQPKDEHEYVLFGDHVGYGCTEDSTDDPPQWFLDLLPTSWSGRPYVHTSAWRGYHDTSSVLEGLTMVESGWMTGDYGDVPWKRDSHAFLEALSEGEIEPPCDVFVLFEPTSNVFSTATEIMARDEDVPALRGWLSFGDFDLHKALS